MRWGKDPPSIQNIYGSISGIKGGKNSVEIIIFSLNQPTPNKFYTKKNSYKLQKKLYLIMSLIIFRKIIFVLRNICFEIKKVKVGIIGETGSEKLTTLIF